MNSPLQGVVQSVLGKVGRSWLFHETGIPLTDIFCSLEEGRQNAYFSESVVLLAWK